MTPPDAVVNAPVTRAHREEAARAFCLEATGDSMSVRWCAEWLDARERGVYLRLGHIVTNKLDAMAQSLANLEAAVRREYEGIVRAAEARRAELEEEQCELWTDAEAQIFNELETLKNG